MGVYDRDYYREDSPGIRLGGAENWSAVVTLIVINVAVWVADMFTGDRWISDHLALRSDLFQHPWQAWQLLTYGFVHDPNGIGHILFNMFALFVFGMDVEGVYGKREFYKLYLSLIVLSGLFNAALQAAMHQGGNVIGASGAIMGVAVIFACHFPRRVLYIWGILPVPAFVLVIGFVVLDLLGAQSHESDVAHWAHLGGAGFGFLYFKTGWSLFSLWPRGLSGKRLRIPGTGPRLKVHREAEEKEEPADDYLTTGRIQQRVDQLLEKISRSGEASLTAEERQFLAEASRRYQQHQRRR